MLKLLDPHLDQPEDASDVPQVLWFHQIVHSALNAPQALIVREAHQVVLNVLLERLVTR